MKLLRFVLCWLLIACKVHYTPVLTQSSQYVINSSTDTTNNASILAHYLSPYRDSLSKSMNEIIGISDTILQKKAPSSTLGNLITDAMLYALQNSTSIIEIAITNLGGIRLNQLPQGNITVGKIYELAPFENQLVNIKIEGAQLKKWINSIAQNGGAPVQGITFKIINKEAQNIQVKTNNKFSSLEDTTWYNIVTIDYIANGGDNCTFLKNMPHVKLNITLRDAIIHYIKEKKRIPPNYLLPIQ